MFSVRRELFLAKLRLWGQGSVDDDELVFKLYISLCLS